MSVVNWNFIAVRVQYVLNLKDSALPCMPNREVPHADASLTPTRATVDAVTVGRTALPTEVASGHSKIEGDGRRLPSC